MKESIIQTMVNKFLIWLSKKSVTTLYKQTHFWIFSWALDEHTYLYIFSEESYHDRHRFGLHEETYDHKDESQKSCSTCGYSPQTPSCDTCEGYSNWWSLEDEPQTKMPCYGCEFSKPKYMEYECLRDSCKYEEEPQTERSNE